MQYNAIPFFSKRTTGGNESRSVILKMYNKTMNSPLGICSEQVTLKT